MRADPAWLDIGDGLVAGLVATKLTEYGQQALWALTPQRIKDQESRVITHECAAGQCHAWRMLPMAVALAAVSAVSVSVRS